MAISDIVAVDVKIQDNFPAQAGFGIPLILAHHTNYVDPRTYNCDASGLSALVADGFPVTHPVYLAASALARQELKCKQFKVGRRATLTSQTLTLTVNDSTEGQRYKFSLWSGGVETQIDYTVPAAQTTTQVATALELLVEAASGVDSTSAANVITITPVNPAAPVYIKGAPRHLVVQDTSADAGVAADLAAVNALDSNWFGLILTTFSKAEIIAAAAWCEANKKVFVATTLDGDVITSSTSDVQSTLKTAGYHFTTTIFTRDGRSYPGAAITSRWFSRVVGSTTLHLKALAGVSADNLTASELGFARGKNAMTYVDTSGIRHTFDGKAASGRFFDITRGIEWLKARLAEAVLAVLANAEKVPYTKLGISIVEAAMGGVLSQAESNGLLAPGWAVHPPVFEEIPSADKATRTLNNMNFSGVLQGAIHSVNMQGSVSL